jgi:hypothetical protein
MCSISAISWSSLTKRVVMCFWARVARLSSTAALALDYDEE